MCLKILRRVAYHISLNTSKADFTITIYEDSTTVNQIGQPITGVTNNSQSTGVIKDLRMKISRSKKLSRFAFVKINKNVNIGSQFVLRVITFGINPSINNITLRGYE